MQWVPYSWKPCGYYHIDVSTTPLSSYQETTIMKSMMIHAWPISIYSIYCNTSVFISPSWLPVVCNYFHLNQGAGWIPCFTQSSRRRFLLLHNFQGQWCVASVEFFLGVLQIPPKKTLQWTCDVTVNNCIIDAIRRPWWPSPDHLQVKYRKIPMLYGANIFSRGGKRPKKRHSGIPWLLSCTPDFDILDIGSFPLYQLQSAKNVPGFVSAWDCWKLDLPDFRILIAAKNEQHSQKATDREWWILRWG